MLRLMESFRTQEVYEGVRDALRLGAISFDAVKHLVLCRMEGRPQRLDLVKGGVKVDRCAMVASLLASDPGKHDEIGAEILGTCPRCSSGRWKRKPTP